jgi:hypothetical protein
MTSPARLDEFDKEEWWDVARRVRPDLTREEYEAMWTEFAELKRRRRQN